MFLVTGGAGFIGSHLVERLVDQGVPVRVLDNFSTGKRSHLVHLQEKIDLVEGDVADIEAVNHAMQGVRIVFHQAAVSSVTRANDNPRAAYAVNVMGTLNVLLAAHEVGCRRVVLASSAAIYGDPPGLPVTEAMGPHPLSHYALSKLSAEHLCQLFSRVYGVETVALRYFNVFGPGQDASAGVIPAFLTALHQGERPTIYGDGEQTRDFTFVDNVVDANLKAATVKGISGRVFNIASGRAITINALLAHLAALVERPPEANHCPPRPNDIRHSVADISAARAALGYEEVVRFEQGLAYIAATLSLAAGHTGA